MKIPPNSISQTEYARRSWTVTSAAPFEEHLNPESWGHVAIKLRAGDRVELSPPDRSYVAELVVLAADKTWAKVALLWKADIQANSTAPFDDYKITHRGPKKWSVLKGKDVLAENLDTRDDAEKFKADHMKAVA